MRLALLTLLVLVWRRTDQLVHPYIWCEDGTEVLAAWLERGTASLFEPVGGYLILPAKVIDLAAFELSFVWYPEIAFALTAAFTVFVVHAIATSPTVLRWPYACAVAVLLVPTGAEVFGVALYTFWWATLLLIVALVWQSEAPQGRRAIFVLIGGFATPLVIPFAALFVARAAFDRKLVVPAIAVGAAAVQAYFVLTMGGEVSAGVIDFTAVLRKFFGYYLSYRWWRSQPMVIDLVSGALVVGIIGNACVLAVRRRDGFLGLLLAVFAIVLLASVVRVNVGGALDPSSGGPRYFFFPWILISWILLWLAHDAASMRGAVFCLGLVMLATVNGVKIMRSHHDRIDWRAEISRCAAAVGSYVLPVHFEGSATKVWTLELDTAHCRRLTRSP